MQEYNVTAGGQTYALDLPFFVLATQNPIEQEGTYPLPEAQLDRFMFMVNIGYPSRRGGAGDRQVPPRWTSRREPEAVLSAEDILAVQKIVRKLPVERARDRLRGEPGAGHAAHADQSAPDFVNDWLTWGAGPRAAQYLVLGAKSPGPPARPVQRLLR